MTNKDFVKVKTKDRFNNDYQLSIKIYTHKKYMKQHDSNQ